MADNLTILSHNYTGVTGLTVTSTGDGTLTYIRPQGTKSITANGNNINVSEYAAVDVAVEGSAVVTDEPNTTGTTAVVTAGDVTTLITKSITQNGTYTASSDSADGYSSVTVNVSGGGVHSTTGTFTGNDGNTVQIACDFAPNVIYVYGDILADPSLRGICSFTIIKDTEIVVTADSSTSAATEYMMFVAQGITGYIYDMENPYVTYSNGTLTLNTVYNSGSARWNSSVTYSYKLVGWDDAPPSPATWETLINGNIHVNEGDPYGGIWISDLGSVSIALDSVWRVTFDNGEPYIVTATANGIYGSPNQNIIGNPLFMGGQDDGSDVPFCFEQNPWGAWTGGTDTSITQDVDHIIKIERQVSV